MAFAMKEAGVSRAINFFFLQNVFFFVKNIQNHSWTVKTCFALSLGFILYTVVEVSMNMALYTSSCQF